MKTAISGYLDLQANSDPVYQPDDLIEGSQEWLNALDYPQENVNGLILSGFVVPVFFVSLFYYRIKRNRMEKEQETNKKEKHD